MRALAADPILDVGASSGQLGRLIAGSGLTIDGIEPDAEAAAEAAPFYRGLQCSTVEDADLPANTYRSIVCADVLEHLPDPEGQLRRLVQSSTAEATFLLSLPNVGHLAARLMLLAGKFPRHSRGIFDRTHLHFYTRETVAELVGAAGLQVVSWEATPVPLEDVWPALLPGSFREATMRMQSAAGRLAPRLFAFQWLIVARRR